MILAAALALAAHAPPANLRVEAALAPRQIPPGRWVADRNDGQCAVLRRTTDERARTIAVQFGPGSGLVRILVFDAGWNRAAVRNRRRVELSFGGGAVSSPRWVSGIESAGEYGFAFDMLDAAVLDQLAASESLTLGERGKLLLELALPSARTAVQTLRDCEDAALRIWGVDVEARARLKRQALPVEPLFRLFSYLDYPAAALSKHVSGRVTVRLVIGKNGRITTCTVVESAGDPVLDRRTCTLLSERARFEPALGPDGRPAEGTSIARVTWAAPRH
jgi:TonB family protein